MIQVNQQCAGAQLVRLGYGPDGHPDPDPRLRDRLGVCSVILGRPGKHLPGVLHGLPREGI